MLVSPFQNHISLSRAGSLGKLFGFGYPKLPKYWLLWGPNGGGGDGAENSGHNRNSLTCKISIIIGLNCNLCNYQLTKSITLNSLPRKGPIQHDNFRHRQAVWSGSPRSRFRYERSKWPNLSVPNLTRSHGRRHSHRTRLSWVILVFDFFKANSRYRFYQR